MSEPNCWLCMNFTKDPVSSPSQCGRGHYYCKSCIKHINEKTGLCPQCAIERNQPPGHMTWITIQDSLPGYEDCEVIAMFFTFYEGIQGTSKLLVILSHLKSLSVAQTYNKGTAESVTVHVENNSAKSCKKIKKRPVNQKI